MNDHFVPAGTTPITLAQVLAIRHPDPPVWAPAGPWIAFLWNDGGLVHLWAVRSDGGEPIQLSRGEQSVREFAWAPSGERLVYAQGGDLWLVAPGQGEPMLFTSGGGDRGPRWSPDGGILGYVRAGKIHLHRFADHATWILTLPAPVQSAHQSGHFAFSPDGSRIAACIHDGRQRDVAVIDLTGRLLWRTDDPENVSDFAWVDGERLHITVVETARMRWREHWLVSVTMGERRLLVREEAEAGLKGEMAPVPSARGRWIAYVLIADGWPHLHLMDLLTGEIRQVSEGACDDTGSAFDRVVFSPDEAWVAFSSNREVQLTEREVWIAATVGGELRRITRGGGSSLNPQWSPDGARIAYLHADPYRSVDIWVTDLQGEGRQLSFSMPPDLSAAQLTPPRHLTYPGVKGLDVHADLMLPKGFDPAQKYPAVVFVHGGMARQMRFGFHPLQSYAVFHAFHQYLLHKGYVVLSVDYRGSIGYGTAYEQATYLTMCVDELDDVVRGADYLKGLGFVDPEGIAVYGISYGGYLTCGALTKHPDIFAVGINIAGIWDYAQYNNWYERLYPGGGWHGIGRMAGHPAEHNAAVWQQGSPSHYVANLKRPLLTLMGTADANVDFAQTDTLITDCVAHGKDFAVAYYPGESHMFTWRKTWADAFPRIEAALERYLRTPPDQRPRAML